MSPRSGVLTWGRAWLLAAALNGHAACAAVSSFAVYLELWKGRVSIRAVVTTPVFLSSSCCSRKHSRREMLAVASEHGDGCVCAGDGSPSKWDIVKRRWFTGDDTSEYKPVSSTRSLVQSVGKIDLAVLPIMERQLDEGLRTLNPSSTQIYCLLPCGHRAGPCADSWAESTLVVQSPSRHVEPLCRQNWPVLWSLFLGAGEFQHVPSTHGLPAHQGSALRREVKRPRPSSHPRSKAEHDLLRVGAVASKFLLSLMFVSSRREKSTNCIPRKAKQE